MSRKGRKVQVRIEPVVGISWFTESEFQLLKEMAKDRDALDATYADWLKNVSKVKRYLRKGGAVPTDVELTVAEIELYCLEHGMENVGPTRAQIVSEKIAAQFAEID